MAIRNWIICFKRNNYLQKDYLFKDNYLKKGYKNKDYLFFNKKERFMAQDDVFLFITTILG